MHIVDLPPVAATLLEAMRAVGYSFQTAIADIVDNSISAGATQIDVMFSPYGEPYVAILDDGAGMDAEQLRTAMRHGSRNPLEVRPAEDLGRFGLGLKTASLSQCRRLTVISVRSGKVSGAIWDLDEVIKRESWSLLELDESDLHVVPEIEGLQKKESGTLVVWQKLDRVFAGEASKDRALQDRIDQAREHLALVFHRFLEAAPGKSPLLIHLNNVAVAPSDPYLRGAKGCQQLPQETFPIDGYYVGVEPYILPHVSHLSATQIAKAGGSEGLRRNQGFYVYRNRRLIIWGTWFRLARQEEMTKLARVMVDVPNALDHLWTLDIKKSTAHPPEAVRHGLLRIVERIADRSRTVYTFRGRKSTATGVVHAWERAEHRGGTVSYKINRDHDLFNTLRVAIPDDQARILEHFAQSLEQSFPFDALYADMAAEQRIVEDIDLEALEESLFERAGLMLDALGRDSAAAKQLKDRLHLLDPFSRYPDIAARIKEKVL